MATRKAEAESLEGLATFLEPFSALVRRSESEHALERYTTGLLSDLPRKTAADIGRALPETNDQRLQEFLTNTAWEAGEMGRSRHTRGKAALARPPCSKIAFLVWKLR